MMGVVVHVYEPRAGTGQYTRIATFGEADQDAFTTVAHLVYRGRCHYDALVVDDGV